MGGHCIGVDPYYLAQKAQELGYHPEIILAGRRLNDSMGEYVASQIVKLMIKKGIIVKGANLLMLGITFKENCPDVRNTKIVDVVTALTEYCINVTIYDPLANPVSVQQEYGLLTNVQKPIATFDAIVLGVGHTALLELNLTPLQNELCLIYDVQGLLEGIVDGRL